MFSIAGLTSSETQYGARISAGWVLLLLLTLYILTVIIYSTARFRSWNEFRAWISSKSRSAGGTLVTPFRYISHMLHSHPRLLHHAGRHS